MISILSRYKIKYLYPILVFTISIVVTLLLLEYYVSRELNRKISFELKEVSEYAKEIKTFFDGNPFSKEISNRYLSGLSAHKNFYLSFITDSRGNIVSSSNKDNKLAEETLKKLQKNLLENFNNSEVALKNLVVSSYNFESSTIQNKKEAYRVWVIHKLKDSKKTISRQEIGKLSAFPVSLLFIFLLISFIFYRFTISRLNSLRTNLTSYALGKRDIKFNVTGNDEISEISKSFQDISMLLEREEKLLLQKEQILNDMIGNLQGIAYKCGDYKGLDIVFISHGCVYLSGYTSDEFLKTKTINFKTLIEKEEYEKTIELIKLQLLKSGKYEVVYKIIHKNGNPRWVLDKGSGIFRENEFISREGLIVDITNSKEAEIKIIERDRQIRQYMDIIESYVVISRTDNDGIITYVSDAYSKLCGYSKEELIGKRHNVLRDPDMPTSFYHDMWKVLKNGGVWSGEIKNRAKNGDSFWVDVRITPTLNEKKEIVEYTSISVDISDRKKNATLAITDDLTGLYNRRFFTQTMPREISRAKREKKRFIFLMADVDFFKKFNDNYGHKLGDEVLAKIGDVMQKTFRRSGDFSFRLGGEEFGIFWHANEYEGVVRIISILRSAVEQLEIEHAFSDVSNKITISIGVCFCQDDYDMDLIYKSADEALYEAKHSGRNQIKYRTV